MGVEEKGVLFFKTQREDLIDATYAIAAAEEEEEEFHWLFQDILCSRSGRSSSFFFV